MNLEDIQNPMACCKFRRIVSSHQPNPKTQFKNIFLDL